MIPAISAPVTANSAGAPAGSAQPANTTSPKPVQVAPSGAGETAAAATKAVTSRAIEAPPQAILALRLRDGENAETEPKRDLPPGPQPAFEETLLQRDARLALEPPDIIQSATERAESEASDEAASSDMSLEKPARAAQSRDNEDAAASRQAEETFSASRQLTRAPDTASVDVSR